MKIAVTSVGSLVGQNILDSLEGRRHGVEVVGINSSAAAAGNFRCDRVYLAPPAARGREYFDRLGSILSEERPDLVLPGRDDDVAALAWLKQTPPSLDAALPVGPLQLARILDDKWASRAFALERGLPYVDSALADDTPAVDRLLEAWGYPLVAKPRHGNGSRGVRIVFDETQRAAIARVPGYLMQAYLEPEVDLMSWRDLARDGVPLFHAPTLQQIACQAVIGPGGELLGMVCTIAELVMGRLERTYRIDDAQVADVVRRYADALARVGWVGSLNLQGRRDRAGRFQVYELNGRCTGGTSARSCLGFDEVGLLAEAFTRIRLPPPRPADEYGVVTKSLSDFQLSPPEIARLERDGCWVRAPAPLPSPEGGLVR